LASNELALDATLSGYKRGLARVRVLSSSARLRELNSARGHRRTIDFEDCANYETTR